MRYLLALLATFGLIVLILFLLLRGGGASTTPKALKLADYSNSDSSAHFITDGPIVADQQHQEVKIDVDADQVTFSLYNGYQGDLVKQTTYPNNSSAYTVFLRSLQSEGFTKGNTDKSQTDERGICPLGQRRIYSFQNSSNQLMRFWSTNCGTKTFGGNIDGVSRLFRNQVPDYDKLVVGTQLDTF